MTTELWMLVGVVLVFAATVMTQAVTLVWEVGVAAALGNRDDVKIGTGGIAGRAARTVANHVEGIAIFAPLVLMAAIAGVSTSMTVLAAKVYLASRLAHAITYLAGIILVRSIIFAIGMIALVVITVELIWA